MTNSAIRTNPATLSTLSPTLQNELKEFRQQMQQMQMAVISNNRIAEDVQCDATYHTKHFAVAEAQHRLDEDRLRLESMARLEVLRVEAAEKAALHKIESDLRIAKEAARLLSAKNELKEAKQKAKAKSKLLALELVMEEQKTKLLWERRQSELLDEERQLERRRKDDELRRKAASDERHESLNIEKARFDMNELHNCNQQQHELRLIDLKQKPILAQINMRLPIENIIIT